MAHDTPPRIPARRLAVLTCMDARIDPLTLLGLELGDAHVIRNAGGLATPDALRSLALSQHALDTRRIGVIHHTDCGVHGVTAERLESLIRADGDPPLPFELETYTDAHASLRATLARLREAPVLHPETQVRAWVFDVATRDLHAFEEAG